MAKKATQAVKDIEVAPQVIEQKKLQNPRLKYQHLKNHNGKLKTEHIY